MILTMWCNEESISDLSWILFFHPVLSTGAPQLFDKMPKEQAKVSCRRKAALEAPVGDGIDALSDTVLQHVLSFVGTAEAVQTCILARRWCGIWKSIAAHHKRVEEDEQAGCQDFVLSSRGQLRIRAFHAFYL